MPLATYQKHAPRSTNPLRGKKRKPAWWQEHRYALCSLARVAQKNRKAVASSNREGSWGTASRMWPDCTERSTTLVQIVLNRPYANPYAHCLRKGPVHSRNVLWECKAGKRTPQGARVHQKTVYSPLAQTARRHLASTACQPQAPGSACLELGCVQAKANWSCKHLSVVWCLLGGDVCALGHKSNSTVVVAAAAAAHAHSHLTCGPGGTCRTLTSSEHGTRVAFTTSWQLADIIQGKLTAGRAHRFRGTR